MKDSLKSRIAAIDLAEPSTIARNRTIAAARERALGPGRKPTRAKYAAIAVALGLLVLTPPGLSLATSVGNLVGIGDEPSEPFDFGESGGETDQAVVGLGETPSGIPYELATSTGPVGTEGEFTCFYVSLPTIDQRTRSASCLTAAALRVLRRAPVGSMSAVRAPGGIGPGADILLSGAATDRVARISIEYPTSDGIATEELELAPFQATSRSARGAVSPIATVDLKAFAAFLPFDLDPRVSSGGEGGPRQFEQDALAMRKASRRYQRQLAEISLRAYDDAGKLIAEISPGAARGSGTSLAVG